MIPDSAINSINKASNDYKINTLHALASIVTLAAIAAIVIGSISLIDKNIINLRQWQAISLIAGGAFVLIMEGFIYWKGFINWKCPNKCSQSQMQLPLHNLIFNGSPLVEFASEDHYTWMDYANRLNLNPCTNLTNTNNVHAKLNLPHHGFLLYKQNGSYFLGGGFPNWSNTPLRQSADGWMVDNADVFIKSLFGDPPCDPMFGEIRIKDGESLSLSEVLRILRGTLGSPFYCYAAKDQ